LVSADEGLQGVNGDSQTLDYVLGTWSGVHALEDHFVDADFAQSLRHAVSCHAYG
jgi:hypothetical protein